MSKRSASTILTSSSDNEEEPTHKISKRSRKLLCLETKPTSVEDLLRKQLERILPKGEISETGFLILPTDEIYPPKGEMNQVKKTLSNMYEIRLRRDRCKWDGFATLSVVSVGWYPFLNHGKSLDQKPKGSFSPGWDSLEAFATSEGRKLRIECVLTGALLNHLMKTRGYSLQFGTCDCLIDKRIK